MSEKKSETKELKPIDPTVLSISEKIQKDLKIERETGTPAEGVYLELAKEHDLDEDTIKRVRQFDELFYAGAGHAVGMKSIPVYKEHKDVTGIKVPFKLTGRDKMVVASKRHTSNVNPQNREETIDTYGAITTATYLAAGNKDSSNFGSIYQHVKAATSAALKDL